MNNAFRFVCAVSLFAILSACVVIPTSTGEGEPFAKRRLAFIEVGKSTKEDIAAEMPRPMEFLGGDLWLYVKTRREAGWLLVLISPSAVDGAKGGGGIDYRYLLIRFDENGVVADFETSGSEKLVGCNRSGVCGTGSTYTLVAPEEQDRIVKNLNVPDNRCSVFVYGKPKTTIRISFDGKNVGGLFDEHGYIFEQLDPGTRRLGATGPNTGGYKGVEFTCESESLVFFRIMTTRPGFLVGRYRIEVTQTDAIEGRQALDNRTQMLRINK